MKTTDLGDQIYVIIGLIVQCQKEKLGHYVNVIKSKHNLNYEVRHFKLKDDHIVVSEAAINKLVELGYNKDDMKHFIYNESIVNHSGHDVEVIKYRNKTIKQCVIKNGEKFIWKDVFIYEHMVTVSDIVNELLKLDTTRDLSIVYNDVAAILDKIYVCKMLQVEDKAINPKFKSKRGFDINKIIDEVYAPSSIKVVK